MKSGFVGSDARRATALLAKVGPVRHIGADGAVAEWLKAAVC
jgi:hypothetical protein